MNTVNNINNSTIINCLLRSKYYRAIRLQYGINYNCVTLLVACYLYQEVIYHKSFTKSGIYKFIEYYNLPLVSKYLSQLVSCNLLTFSGHNKYCLTESGIKAIQEISNNKDNYFINFCQDHNIEL